MKVWIFVVKSFCDIIDFRGKCEERFGAGVKITKYGFPETEYGFKHAKRLLDFELSRYLSRCGDGSPHITVIILNFIDDKGKINKLRDNLNGLSVYADWFSISRVYAKLFCSVTSLRVRVLNLFVLWPAWQIVLFVLCTMMIL